MVSLELATLRAGQKRSDCPHDQGGSLPDQLLMDRPLREAWASVARGLLLQNRRSWRGPAVADSLPAADCKTDGKHTATCASGKCEVVGQHEVCTQCKAGGVPIVH